MAPLEPSDSTRPEHPNTDDAEQKNDLKHNFMKMIESLKKEMKNSLRKMEENTKNGRNQQIPPRKSKKESNGRRKQFKT